MKTLRFTSFAAGLALLFAGCTGPAGPQGAPGADGLNGNANVAHSFYTPYALGNPWANNGTFYYANLSDPNLTQNIQDQGATEVFLTIDGAGTTWTALPFTYYGGSNPNYIWAYSTNTGNITITWTSEGVGIGSDPNVIYGAACGFKVVDIEASVMKRHPNTDWKNYYQVMSVANAENPNNKGITVRTIQANPTQSVK